MCFKNNLNYREHFCNKSKLSGHFYVLSWKILIYFCSCEEIAKKKSFKNDKQGANDKTGDH